LTVSLLTGSWLSA